MRKALDLVLVVAVVAGLAYGAYTVGHLVTRTSNEEFSRSSGTPQTTTRSTGTSVSARLRRHESEGLVALLIVAAIVLVAALAAVGGSIRRRRRARRVWRLRE